MGEALFETVPGLLVRASSPFGGGVGGCREEMCGILSGGVILIGALLGRETCERPDEKAQEIAKMWRARFVELMGATRCDTLRDALPDEPHRCRPLIRQGAEILLDLLSEWTIAP